MMCGRWAWREGAPPIKDSVGQLVTSAVGKSGQCWR
jgi:hypothetical protein